ncbi:putative transcriptional regulator [Acidovorax soli]|uniref:Putative transcriptional regulator n=1 Tax=Acidovorax soli TaxID=592050 RepID=A0A7X0PD50_9BURK|nr:hypothetical protein [Acidovorax soli]MBB6559614.1 putative transcriptional regulator [Acidovorax soli]
MPNTIPSIQEVRERLAPLGVPALHELADETSVPFATLVKIRSGYTPNPGIETVRKFYPSLKAKTSLRKRRKVA